MTEFSEVSPKDTVPRRPLPRIHRKFIAARYVWVYRTRKHGGMIDPRRIRKEETVQRVVVLVLASGVASVLALGAGFVDSKVGIAKAKKCPPGSTPEKVDVQHGGLSFAFREESILCHR